MFDWIVGALLGTLVAVVVVAFATLAWAVIGSC